MALYDPTDESHSIDTVLRYKFKIIIVIMRKARETLCLFELIISDIYLLNSLSSSGKTDIPTVLRYKFNIFIVIMRKAGKQLKMRDIPGEWFVKLSQVRYRYGIAI
jgi:hypothetical protein